MVKTTRIRLDRISSSTRNAHLGPEVIIGDDINTFVFWRELFDAGVFVNAFISPGVPNGMQMLRTSYMATHEQQHLDKILETFGMIGKKLGVIH